LRPESTGRDPAGSLENNPNYKITFARGDYVYINRGQDQGVRVGDRFTVVRPDKDPTDVPWFSGR